MELSGAPDLFRSTLNIFFKVHAVFIFAIVFENLSKTIEREVEAYAS